MGMGSRRNDGAVMDYSEPGVVEGRLYAFDIGSAGLLFMHRTWLDTHVIPVLEGGGTMGMTGLASRSGASAFNLELSKRRANAVLHYLDRHVSGHVSYRMATDYTVDGVNGVGEELARQSGQRDGTEDAYHRAVIVTAWQKPTPPATPKPKPPAEAPKIKRVASRTWNKFNSRMPAEAGEAGNDWGEIVGDVLSGGGGTVERTYAMIPSDHVITHIRDEFVVDNKMGFGVSTTDYTRTIEYRWGPATDRIFLLKRQKQIETGKDYGWNIQKRDHLPAKEVWKHTIAPDQ